MPGTLYLVATPIGNLADVPPRAVEMLKTADLIACEDTRHTGRLCSRFGIETHRESFHEHNAHSRRPRLLKILAEGGNVALVSDAGTPLVSDPGYKLVRDCHEAGIPVSGIPGPCSPILALTLSGLPTDRFRMEGFLPATQQQRTRRLSELATAQETLIFLESPNRLAASLKAMADAFGNRLAAVAREMTKRHEEVRRAPLGELTEMYADTVKGEIVVVVAGAAKEEKPAKEEVRRMLSTALEAHTLKDAVAAVTEASGWRKREIYQMALTMKEVS